MGSLLKVLDSFVRWKVPGAIELRRPESTGSEEWLLAQARFQGYTWAVSSGPGRSGLFGISPLAASWPLCSPEFERVIANPARANSSRYCRAVTDPDVEYYVALELWNHCTVKADFVMLVDACEWYLLDQRVLPFKDPGAVCC